MDAGQLLEKIDAYTEAKIRAMVVKLHLVAVNELRERTVREREAQARQDLLIALVSLVEKQNGS